MYQRLRSVTLLCFLISWIYAQTVNLPAGVCEIEPLKCCGSYRRVEDRCEECWPGSFGVNCKDTCPDGYYGKLCREKCNCTPCDKIVGCRHNSTSNKQNPPIAENIDWRSTVMFVSGSAGLCFIIGFILHNKLRKHRYAKRSNPRENDETPLDVPDSSVTSQFNQCASSTTSGGYPENLISKEPHLSSKRHNRSETLSSNRCLTVNVAFKACSTSQDADNISNTSENVYSHLNMDASPYNTLHETSESETGPNVGIYSKSSQRVTSTDSNFYNTSVTICRRSFLYPEDVLPKGDKYSPLNNDISNLDNASETIKSNIQKTEEVTASLTRKVKMPSKRERLAKKMHMNEMSKMLENFKPKTEEGENNNSKANIIHRQRSSKKVKKKLLRYSFAPSTEIA